MKRAPNSPECVGRLAAIPRSSTNPAGGSLPRPGAFPPTRRLFGRVVLTAEEVRNATDGDFSRLICEDFARQAEWMRLKTLLEFDPPLDLCARFAG